MWPKDSCLVSGEADLQILESKVLTTVQKLLERFHQETLSQVKVLPQNACSHSPVLVIKKLTPNF